MNETPDQPPRRRKALTQVERLVVSLVLLLAVIIVGVLGFMLLEKRSLGDSLYMTLITISTLGMKSDESLAITPVGKFLVMLLIVVGIASAMIVLSLMVSMIVEGQVRRIFGRRHVSRKIESLSNHYIVCGYGRSGAGVCAHLARHDQPLVVIDTDDERTAAADAAGLLYLLGDATQEAFLTDAGIKRARGLVAALSTDGDNVLVTLVARELSRDLFIAANAEKTESEPHLRRAGANAVICPRVIGAKRLANILLRPGVVDFIDFASEGLDLEAEQFQVSPESKLVGKSLQEANLPREIGILVVAIKRPDGRILFNPSADTVIQPDDVMIVTGRLGSMHKLEQNYR